MKLTLIYTIFNVVVACISSVGKKWNDELNIIWKNQFNKWFKYLYIYIIIDIVFLLIEFYLLCKYEISIGVTESELMGVILTGH